MRETAEAEGGTLEHLLARFRLAKIDLVLVAIAIPLELLNITPSLSGALSSSAWMALAYLLAGFVILLWRQLFPRLVLTALLVHQGLFSPIFYGEPFIPSGMVFNPTEPFSIPYIPLFTVVVAVVTVGATCPRWVSALFCLPAVVLPTLLFSAGRPMDAPWYVFASALWIGGAWSFGQFISRSKQEISQLELERQKTEAAMAAERAHIAAELHDIVSHAVTVMLLHAAGGRRIIDSDPSRAAQALEVIASVGAEATQELSRLLSLLNPDRISSPGKSLPSLENTLQLVETFRRAGIDVQVKESGLPKKLDASVDHTAYRAIQESLTNVSKHVGPSAKVLLKIDWKPDKLRLRIEDDGGERMGASLQSPSGFGLLGLKERVGVAGGKIDWGPQDTGFAVDLSLPLSRAGTGSPMEQGHV